MSEVERPTVPIIRTKLRRPHLSADLVSRPRLLGLLDEALETPLTLVSAPAGYGKSVLVCQWAERQKVPCAWLSLDESESELKLFLTYLLAAIDSVLPEACPSTREVVGAPELAPVPAVGGHLINELDAIEAPFVLILEDYHHIASSSPVHQLLELVLKNPPRSLHVVINTRHDPPLPVSLLWGDRRTTSLRFEDLKFSWTETAEFLYKAMHVNLSEEALAHLDKELEGWAIGLRLLSLALRQVDDPDRFAKELRGGLPQTQEYLLQEVLARQAPEIRSCLLKSSILDRFCAPLLDAVFEAESVSAPPRLGGSDFVDRLQLSNLFTTSHGGYRDWFRYHKLFQEFLNRQLQRELQPSAIARLHARASDWFESEGLIEEAIHHALAAGEPHRAGEIVARNRFAKLEEQWAYVVGRWLDLLPEDVQNRSPELLLARLFTLVAGPHRLELMPPIIEQLESLEADDALDDSMVAEMNLYRGLFDLFGRGDGESARRRLESAKARGRLGSGLLQTRLEFYLAMARLMTGEGERAMASLEERIRSIDPRDVKSYWRQAGHLVIVRLLAGDLVAAARGVAPHIEMARTHRIADMEGWALYVRANAELQTYQLSEALADFEGAAKKKNAYNRRVAVDTLTGLALTSQALHRDDEANSALETLDAFARELEAPALVTLAESARARVRMLQGQVDEAARWADTFSGDLLPMETFWFLEVPALTQTRAWIASGHRDNLEKSLQRLCSLRQMFQRMHFVAHEIEVLALQAVALEMKGHDDEAPRSLDEALALAAPRGFVRPFIEAGPTMAAMLDRSRGQTEWREFTHRLLETFESNEAGAQRERPAPARPLSSPPSAGVALTNREFDILELLGKRFRDKEIAEELVVSPSTVNQHLKQIYRKLGVNNRRQAVEKAVALGILNPTRNP